MKRAVAVALVLACGLGLTGCVDKDYESAQDKRYRLCVENGGDWQSGAWNEESCTMP